MIKCDSGLFESNGSKRRIMAEFTCIVQSLIYEKSFTKEELIEKVNLGAVSQEQVNNMSDEEFEKFLNEVGEMMEDEEDNAEKH